MPSTNADGTPRSSTHLPSTLDSLTPTWRPPKAPLPPHRLAKLANALGVSTPIPATHKTPSWASRSYSESSTSVDMRRSPTPSTTGSAYYAPSTSKYLLHVIPPLSLPHDSDSVDDDSEMTPPPVSATGYHTQFRRGTLVPVYATLQAQLGAIAKEYALPSTAGLILYLTTTVQSSNVHRSDPHSAQSNDDDETEPGPRLSEEVWKHLWTRVIHVEQQDENMMTTSRSQSPHAMSLGIGLGNRSTPFLPQSSALRPLLSLPTIDTGPQANYPFTSFTSSPSTPSSVSDIPSNTKSAPPSSSQSEPDTPDTSVDDSAVRANSLDLPGLRSPSLIPILAKVEFDIDRRKAGWYEPWLRSRRVNFAKRALSRAEERDVKAQDDASGEESQEKPVLIQLLTGRQQTASPLFLTPAGDVRDDDLTETEGQAGGKPLDEDEDVEGEEEAGYEQLSDSDSDEQFSDEEVFEEDEATARVLPLSETHDPLDEVFGTDADTWADMHASDQRQSKHLSNPNVVDLALTGADLDALPDPDDLEDDHRVAGQEAAAEEEDEVQELLDLMSRPSVAVDIIPSSPGSSKKRSTSPIAVSRKHVPPPLVLVPDAHSTDLAVPVEPSPMPTSAGTMQLPYLDNHDEELHDEEFDEEFDEYTTRVRSPAESDKRGGTIFDDLDLGLDPTEEVSRSIF